MTRVFSREHDKQTTEDTVFDPFDQAGDPHEVEKRRQTGNGDDTIGSDIFTGTGQPYPIDGQVLDFAADSEILSLRQRARLLLFALPASESAKIPSR